jgi:benzil reductase ((S)-benzoin forming)
VNYHYVTGASRGLGRAIADRLLQDPDNIVVGVARGEGIEHERYRHHRLDLSDVAAVQAFTFEPHAEAAKVTLVNNAGRLVVDELGQVDAQSIVEVCNVNLVAPFLLTNAFVRAYRGVSCPRVVLNIASGAGRAAVPGVSTMCVTKAGLDMLSRVLVEEQTLTGDGIQVFSVSPGLVDTDMYAVGIEAADPARPARGVMAGRLRSQQAAAPAVVAEKLCRLLERSDLPSEVLLGIEGLD